MPAIVCSSICVRIQQILRVTTKHFEILALPDAQRALPQEELIDSLRSQWSDTPALRVRHPPTARGPVLWAATRCA